MKYVLIRIANACTWLSGCLNTVAEKCINEAKRLHDEETDPELE